MNLAQIQALPAKVNPRFLQDADTGQFYYIAANKGGDEAAAVATPPDAALRYTSNGVPFVGPTVITLTETEYSDGIYTETGTSGGRIAYTGDNGKSIFWNGTLWAIGTLGEGPPSIGSWTAIEDVQTPQEVTAWVAEGDETGYPVLETAAGVTPKFIGQWLRYGTTAPYAWYVADSMTSWVREDASTAAILRTAAQGAPTYTAAAIAQRETITVTSPGVASAGTKTVNFTVNSVSSSVNVAITGGQTTAQVAESIRTALDALPQFNNFYVTRSGSNISLLSTVPGLHDVSLQVSWATSQNITSATSVNTTEGVPAITASVPTFIGRLCRVGDSPPYTWYRADSLSTWIKNDKDNLAMGEIPVEAAEAVKATASIAYASTHIGDDGSTISIDSDTFIFTGSPSGPYEAPIGDLAEMAAQITANTSVVATVEGLDTINFEYATAGDAGNGVFMSFTNNYYGEINEPTIVGGGLTGAEGSYSWNLEGGEDAIAATPADFLGQLAIVTTTNDSGTFEDVWTCVDMSPIKWQPPGNIFKDRTTGILYRQFMDGAEPAYEEAYPEGEIS